MKKFKTDAEAKLKVDEQKNLEAQGKFDEAMKLHNTRLSELNNVIGQKDVTINNMQIGNALTSAIVAQGGYLEESLAMLKSFAEIKDGVVVIKGKDSNGLDQSYSVSDGVKSFLEKRPHLVKANANTGGGDSGNNIGNTGSAGNEEQGSDLSSLHTLLQKQTYANDFKGIADTRAKIKALAHSSGMTISNGIV